MRVGANREIGTKQFSSYHIPALAGSMQIHEIYKAEGEESYRIHNEGLKAHASFNVGTLTLSE